MVQKILWLHFLWEKKETKAPEIVNCELDLHKRKRGREKETRIMSFRVVNKSEFSANKVDPNKNRKWNYRVSYGGNAPV